MTWHNIYLINITSGDFWDNSTSSVVATLRSPDATDSTDTDDQAGR